MILLLTCFVLLLLNLVRMDEIASNALFLYGFELFFFITILVLGLLIVGHASIYKCVRTYLLIQIKLGREI